MEHLLGFVGYVLRQLVFNAIFFWPGWVLLRALTLGRYPRLRGPRRNVDADMDADFICFVGLLTTVALIVGLASVF